MLECLNQVTELCLKLIGVISGVFIFFIPLFYYLRLRYEVNDNIKLRNDTLFQLCNSESDWIEDDDPIFNKINESVKPFSFVNTISQELFSLKLFDNKDPINNNVLKDCKMIPMYNIRHFLKLYNKSLLSGFWSLILKPVKLLDKNHFKIIVANNTKNKSIKMLIVIDYEKDYIRYFKFIINL